MSSYANTFIGTLDASKQKSKRQLDMEIIEDLMNGNGFKHYKNRFLQASEFSMNEEDLMKIYHSRNEIKTIVKKFSAYCPTLTTFVPAEPLNESLADINKAQKKVVDRFLKDINWKIKNTLVYEDLETKGDVFYYYYFENPKSKMLKFKALNSKQMVDIVLDSNGKPSAYKYIEHFVETTITETGDILELYKGEVIWIYQKGKTDVYKQAFIQDNSGKYIAKMENNKKTYDKKTYFNRASYLDEIPIVRISSYLRDGEKFSEIPASDYIEHQLMMDDLNSHLRYINMRLGYPSIFVINGRVIKGEWKPGGFIYIDNINESDENGSFSTLLKSEAKVQDLQISNDLKSIFTYHTDEDDSFRESAGLISKTLQMKLGSSDSSRVIQQLIAPMVNKIELYEDNIITAFEVPIKILLKENDLWDEDRDFGLSLFKPPFPTSVSPFDEQIFEQNSINMGAKNNLEVALEKNESYEKATQRTKSMENEANAESSDSVRSANNL